jgi:hypothetical protein
VVPFHGGLVKHREVGLVKHDFAYFLLGGKRFDFPEYAFEDFDGNVGNFEFEDHGEVFFHVLDVGPLGVGNEGSY